MSCGGTRARGIPKKTKGILEVGVSSTEARRSSTGDPHSSTGGRRRLWIQRTATASLTATDPGADDVGVHGDAELPVPAERLQPRGRGGDAVLGQVDGAAALDAFDDREPHAADLELAADPALLLERLGRLQDQVGAQPPPVGVDPELARTPLEGGGADERDRAGVEVRGAVLEEHLDAVAEALGQLRVEGRVAGRPRVIAAADPDGARRPPSPRRTRRPRRGGGTGGCPCRPRTVPSPSTTAYARSPTRPRLSMSTRPRASPPIDFTG